MERRASFQYIISLVRSFCLVRLFLVSLFGLFSRHFFCLTFVASSAVFGPRVTCHRAFTPARLANLDVPTFFAIPFSDSSYPSLYVFCALGGRPKWRDVPRSGVHALCMLVVSHILWQILCTLYSIRPPYASIRIHPCTTCRPCRPCRTCQEGDEGVRKIIPRKGRKVEMQAALLFFPYSFFSLLHFIFPPLRA